MAFKYKIENINFKELKNRAVVPKFQRKLVWSINEKKSFIETLSKGYPFGAILIYKYENEEKYSIIDGLQRYTTIMDYVENPENYIQFHDIIENTFFTTFIDLEVLPVSTQNSLRKTLNNVVKQFVEEASKGNDSLNKFYKMLVKELPDIFLDIEMEKFLELEKVKDLILNRINNHLNVESLPIPTIIFTGEVEELATVFENLNRGGKKLSKYQVFAAQWSKHELKLSKAPFNERLLEITINRYEDLIETRKVEINNFSREEMEEERIINVAEFAYALGKLIAEKMYVFWNKQNEDIANQVGYSTLAIIFGIKNKEMNTLVNYFDKLDDPYFIEKVVEEVLKIYHDINAQFKDYLKIPGRNESNYYGGRNASDLQLLSFFGSLWRLKFGHLQAGKLEIKPKYKNNYNLVEKNLLKYFIYDIVNSHWSGTGDTKLDDIVIENNRSYLKDLPEEKFRQGLYDWHDEIVNKNSINFEPVSRMLYTILSYYYSPKYTEKKYDSEHIIARKHINDIRKQSNQSVPGGALGNHMYLDSASNRSKQEFSLYDLEKPGLRIEEDFYAYQNYPTKKEMNEIKTELDQVSGSYEQLIQTITRRGEYLLDDLIKKIYLEQ